MRPLLLALILGGLALSTDRAQAQTEATDADEGLPLARTGLYVELLGSGVGLSLHYDHLVNSTPEGHVSVHAGVGIAPFAGFTVPVGVSYLRGYLRGRGSHLLEAGLSAVLVFGEGGEMAGLPMGLVGYRYQPRGRGVLFRIGLGLATSSAGALLLPGLSLGLAGE